MISGRQMARKALDDKPVPVRTKLAALWAALMACFIYGDYFELYQPGKLRGMLSGLTAVGPTGQPILLGFAILLSAPAVMIYLSLALGAIVCRWANILLGLFYAGVVLLAIQGGWAFYVYLGVVEIVLCLTIVWHAARWPRRLIETAENSPA